MLANGITIQSVAQLKTEVSKFIFLSCLIPLQVLLVLPPEDLLNLLTLLHYHHYHLLPDHCNSLLTVLVVITLSLFPIFLFSTM